MDKQLDYLEIIKYIREIEDELKEVSKVLEVFGDDRNWNPRYTDKQGRIDKFDYLDYDPRIIADRGTEAAKKAIKNIQSLVYRFIDPHQVSGVDRLVLNKKKALEDFEEKE